MAETRLRDGSLTRDPRLDRIAHFDPRSRQFPVALVPAVRAAKRPRSYTWSLSTQLDQGSEGACVGFAWSHEAAARPASVTGVTDAFARERVYWEAQRIDPWDGGAYPGASPQYEGTSVLAGAKVMAGLGAFTEYRWAFGLDDLILAVGYAGPAVIGVPWYEGMISPTPDGHVGATGDVVGGHAILVRGVSVKGRRFLLHNSWGAGWGVTGCCYVTFDLMDRLLNEQGEACVPIDRRAFSVGAVAAQWT